MSKLFQKVLVLIVTVCFDSIPIPTTNTIIVPSSFEIMNSNMNTIFEHFSSFLFRSKNTFYLFSWQFFALNLVVVIAVVIVGLYHYRVRITVLLELIEILIYLPNVSSQQ